MKRTSILRSSKVTRVLFGGFVLLIVIALIGIGFNGKVVAGSTNALATGISAVTAQNGGQVSPQVRSFTGGAITINQSGIATPYPSDIVVAVSPSATISKLTVTINGFQHTSPDDVDIILQGPGADPNGQDVTIWSDAGGFNPASGITITLDDAAAAGLPDNGPLVSGTFKPTNFEGDETLNAPGPQVPRSGTTLAFFNGTNANGTWHLWVQDDTGGDAGTITSWSLNITFGPTLARMLGGSATVDDDGLVDLKWQTGYEVDNLGFNIYREEGGQRTRVNKHLIAGSALVAGQGTAMTAGRNYRWRDTTAKPGQSVQYWVEAKDLNGSSILSGPFSPIYSPGRLDPQPSSATLGDVGRGGASGPGKVNLSSVSAQAAPSGQTAFKLDVKQTGYYRLTQSDLIAAGLSPDINPRKLQLFEDGNERPIIVQGEKDGRFDADDAIEFYATAPENAYTDTHVYRLVAGSQKGQRIKTVTEQAGTAGADSFLFTTELKEKNIYFPGLRNGEQENFFGAVVAREPVVRALSLSHVARSAPASATLEVALQGVSTASHDVRVILNGADVGALTFEGQSAGIARINVPQSSLKEGDNSVELVAQGGDSDVSLMGALRLNYWHSYAADNDALQFTASAGEPMTIAGFSNPAIRVMDLSNAEKGGLKEVAGAIRQDGNGYSVTFSVPGEGARTLLAFASNQVKRPAAIIADTPSSWRKHDNKADLVIFARRDFFSALEPLRAQRQSQGYKVAIVDIEDVYDEFSNGNKTPQAIKDFLAYATSSWKVKPRFAILAGDASFDPKNYLGAGDWDIIPTKLIDTKLMETASDDWFADFNGDSLPEMAVGRLPARSAQEMSALVGKIIGYDNSSPIDTMLLVSDSNDTFDFENASQGLRTIIPGDVKALEIARGTTDDDTSRALLLNYINQGQKVINYIGHGNLDVWRGNIFTSEDASSLTNGRRLSLFVTMTCLNGYFQDATVESIAEALVKTPNGGAVAAWASTGMCDPEEQVTLNQEFYRLLFGGGSLTVGEAAMKSKSSVKDKDIRRTWVLLGDPTTRLR